MQRGRDVRLDLRTAFVALLDPYFANARCFSILETARIATAPRAWGATRAAPSVRVVLRRFLTCVADQCGQHACAISKSGTVQAGFVDNEQAAKQRSVRRLPSVRAYCCAQFSARPTGRPVSAPRTGDTTRTRVLTPYSTACSSKPTCRSATRFWAKAWNLRCAAWRLRRSIMPASTGRCGADWSTTVDRG